MNLYLVRHAIAEDQKVFSLKSIKDSERALTKHGRQKFKNTVNHLSKLIGPVDLIVGSPYRRAKETAHLLIKQYPELKLKISKELVPQADPSEFKKWCSLNLNEKMERVVLVGHEPHLGKLASWLLFGDSQNKFINIKKGSCLALSVKMPLGPKTATLKWLVTPKLLDKSIVKGIQ